MQISSGGISKNAAVVGDEGHLHVACIMENRSAHINSHEALTFSWQNASDDMVAIRRVHPWRIQDWTGNFRQDYRKSSGRLDWSDRFPCQNIWL